MDLDAIRKELTEQGFVVQKQEELDKLIENNAAERVDRAIKERDKEFYSSWDAEISSLIGEEKPTEVKTKDFIVSKIQQLRDESAKAKELQEKIKTLEKSSGNTELISQLQEQIESIKSEKDSVESQYKTLLEEEKSKFSKTLKQKEVERSMEKLKFSEDLDADIVKTYQDKALRKVLEYRSETRDGKIVFLNGDGEVMRNKENALDPYTLDELLSLELKPVLQKKESKVGTGTKPKAGTETVTDDNNLPVPDRNFSTRIEASEYARSKGLNGTEMMKFMLKHAANLPLK